MADTIYHVAPITPNARFKAVAADDPGRAFMLSYYRPDQTQLVCDRAAFIAFDCGAFSYHTEMIRLQKRVAAGKASAADFDRLSWLMQPRDWRSYYSWLEPLLFSPGRWAIIPDVISEGSQAQDALIRARAENERMRFWLIFAPKSNLVL